MKSGTLSRFATLVVTISSALSLCHADEERPIQPVAPKLERDIDFAKDIAPILRTNCIACHNKSKTEGDLNLENVGSILKGGASGQLIVPGQPDDSYLYLVAARIEESFMPPWPNSVEARRLTPEELGLLRQWILEGARDSAGSSDTAMNWQGIHDRLNAVYAVDIAPQARYVAAGRAGNVIVYDRLNSDHPGRLIDPELSSLNSPRQKTHRDYVHAIAFHPQGQMIATAGYRVVKIWERNVEIRQRSKSSNEQPETEAANATVPAGEYQLKRTPEGATEVVKIADGASVANLNQDFSAVRELQAAERSRAFRDARVTVVTAEVKEAEARVAEQKKSLEAVDASIKKATEALKTARTKADEEQKKLAAARQAAEAKPDDEGLAKKVEQAAKADEAARKAVADAETILASAMKSKELNQQAIQRAEENLASRQQALEAAQVAAKDAQTAVADHQKQVEQPCASGPGTLISDKLAATIDDSGIVRLWQLPEGKPVDRFTVQMEGVPVSIERTADSVDVTGTNEESASAATSGTAGLVTVATDSGKQYEFSIFPEWKLGRSLGPISPSGESEFEDRVLALEFSPDGIHLAAGGGEASRSGELTLWNALEGTLVRRFPEAHSDTVYGIDFSLDGQLLASAAADKFVKVFDVSTGKHIRSFEGHTHHVMDVSWKGDGTRLASAGADSAIKIWNTATGEQTRTITTYSKQVTALQFVAMSDEFVSSSGDHRVFRHRAANGGTVREFRGSPDFVYCVATTGQGEVVAAGCEDGAVRLWDGTNGKLIATFAAP